MPAPTHGGRGHVDHDQGDEAPDAGARLAGQFRRGWPWRADSHLASAWGPVRITGRHGFPSLGLVFRSEHALPAQPHMTRWDTRACTKQNGTAILLREGECHQAQGLKRSHPSQGAAAGFAENRICRPWPR